MRFAYGPPTPPASSFWPPPLCGAGVAVWGRNCALVRRPEARACAQAPVPILSRPPRRRPFAIAAIRLHLSAKSGRARARSDGRATAPPVGPAGATGAAGFGHKSAAAARAHRGAAAAAAAARRVTSVNLAPACAWPRRPNLFARIAFRSRGAPRHGPVLCALGGRRRLVKRAPIACLGPAPASRRPAPGGERGRGATGATGRIAQNSLSRRRDKVEDGQASQNNSARLASLLAAVRPAASKR